MSLLSTTADFQRELEAQKAGALAAFGQDPQASSAARVGRPYTPPEYAMLLFGDWAETYYPAARKEMESHRGLFGFDTEAESFLRQAEGERRLLTDGELSRMAADTPHPHTREMTRGLVKARDAMTGATRISPLSPGLRVLSPQGAADYWDGIQRFVLAAVATRASVTTGQRWSAFLDGAEGGLHDAASWVGETAARVAEEAGEAVGSTLGGVISGLGPITTLALIGAGIYVWKVA